MLSKWLLQAVRDWAELLTRLPDWWDAAAFGVLALWAAWFMYCITTRPKK